MAKIGLRWDEAQLREFERRQNPAAEKPRPPRVDSESERILWRALSPLGFVREYEFNPLRRWRLDFAHVDLLIAVEIEGQVHRIESRFLSDLEKYNRVCLDGWLLLRFAPAQVRSDEAAAVVWDAMNLQVARVAAIRVGAANRRGTGDANAND